MTTDETTTPDIDDADLSQAVMLAIMTAAQRMLPEPDDRVLDVLAETWPELLDANALTVAATVALAVASIANLSADDLIAAAVAATD